MTSADDTSGAWVAADERGLRLRHEGLAWYAWHPRRPWIALVHAVVDEEVWWVLDVACARVLVSQRVDGVTCELTWVDDDVLARTVGGREGVRVDLLAVPDGGVIASRRLPFRTESPVRLVWLPAAKVLVVRGEVADDGRTRSALCVLDPELRVLRLLDSAAVNPHSSTPYFDVMALDPDGQAVALWYHRERGWAPVRPSHVAIVSLTGAAPVRRIVVERMRGRSEYFGDEFGRPFVHGARWSRADRIEFYGERDTARVDPRDGRCTVTEDDNTFQREEVVCHELAAAAEARVTLCLATDRWGLMTPHTHWGVRFDEGSERVGCWLPWRRAEGWSDEEIEVLNHATSAAGFLGLLTAADGSQDAVTARVVDLRAGRAGRRAAEVATLEGQCGTIVLSPDARWVFVSAVGRMAGRSWVFPADDLAWAPMAP